MNQTNLKSTFLISLVAVVSVFLNQNAYASCNQKTFDEWKECFVSEKLDPISDKVDIDVFNQAEYTPSVIKLDRKQPEKTYTFDGYKRLIDLPLKIKKANSYYCKNREIAEEISKEYGVEAQALVALVMMESNGGAIMGKHNLISSMATLAYEGRRKEFFEKELINALKIAKQEGLSYEEMLGSWAGAMGQVQFMPSSYLMYAVDHDQDGKRDIWNSTADALASAANYLKQNGWVKGRNQIKSLSHKQALQKSGKKCSNLKKCSLGDNTLLISMEKSDKIPAYYNVGSNYEAIMKWNRSTYFAASVLTIVNNINLADE